MKIRLTGLATAVVLAFAAGSALAAPMVPTYDSFSNLAGATYGGSGIPTDPSAITTIVDGATTITLGTIAHQRFANPALTNDGAGTFFAVAGTNDGTPGNPGTAATWNVGFYINIAGGGKSIDDYAFKFLYDFDPAAGTDQSLAGTWDLTATVVGLGGGALTLVQDSENATFAFLCTSGGPISAPASCPFDANALGEYSFALTAASLAGVELGRSGINVDVVPEPASLALLGLGLAGLGFSRRRKA